MRSSLTGRYLTAAAVVALVLAVVAGSGCSPAPSEPWPPSTSGLPVFYYFGDPG